MNVIKLDTIAVWRPKLNDCFRAKSSAPGRTYYENNIAKKSDEPIVSYAKNYTRNRVKFCLFVMSFAKDEKEIEKFLDATSKTIDLDFIKDVVSKSTATDFAYTDIKMEIK